MIKLCKPNENAKIVKSMLLWYLFRLKVPVIAIVKNGTVVEEETLLHNSLLGAERKLGANVRNERNDKN